MNPTDKKVKQRPTKTQQNLNQNLQQPSRIEKTSNLNLQHKKQKDLDEKNEKERIVSGQSGGINSLISSSFQQPSSSGLQFQLQMNHQTGFPQFAPLPHLQQSMSGSSIFTNQSLMEIEKPKKGAYKKLYESDSDDDNAFISIKKKKIEVQKKPIQQSQSKIDEIKQSNIIVIPAAPLNINKDILLQTSKDQNSLTMVRNILSAGSKKLADKQIIFKKKWTQLRNSNCSHEEYFKWEEQLKRNETFDIKDIKETTIQRLINSKIRGFISQEQLLEKGKLEYITRNQIVDEKLLASKEFKLDEKQFEEFRNDQFTLLEKLMKENNLVAIDMMKPDMMKQAREMSNSVLNNPMMLDDPFNDDLLMLDHNNKNELEKQLEFLDEEENNVQKVSLCKYFETKVKIETTSNQTNNIIQNQSLNQTTDVNGTKLITSTSSTNSTSNNNNNNSNNNNNNNNNNSINPYDIEKNIEKYSFQKIFKSYDDFIHLQSSDNCLIAKRVKSLLLDIKSDELFTDAKFQKEQFEKYQKLLKSINDVESLDMNKVNEETIKELVEIAAYIMNNVHYFQKFNLKCDLLHPLDLLYVTEKFLKSSSSQALSSSNQSSVSTSNQPSTSVQTKKS